MNNIRIRKMLISDYDAVYSLWISCKGMGLNNLDDSKDGIDRFLNRNPDTCLIAEINDSIVGVIIAGDDGRRGYIYHTAVDSEFRHRGIGGMLVSAVMEALKRHGVNKVALVVFERNSDGNAFWEKCGFTIRNDLIYRNKAIADMIRNDT